MRVVVNQEGRGGGSGDQLPARTLPSHPPAHTCLPSQTAASLRAAPRRSSAPCCLVGAVPPSEGHSEDLRSEAKLPLCGEGASFPVGVMLNRTSACSLPLEAVTLISNSGPDGTLPPPPAPGPGCEAGWPEVCSVALGHLLVGSFSYGEGLLQGEVAGAGSHQRIAALG